MSKNSSPSARLNQIMSDRNIKQVDILNMSVPFQNQLDISSVFAQLEREQIRERMQLGRIGRAKSGKAMAWEDKMFGYKYDHENDTLVIDEYEAMIVKRMFEMYLSGMAINKIQQQLNSEGGHGKDKWHYNSVFRILKNPIYAGYNSYLGEVYKGNHEAIISLETHEKTLKEIEMRGVKQRKEKNPRPFQSKYMLSGLLRCNKCGGYIKSRVSPSYKGSKVHYVCRHREPVRSKPTKEKFCKTGYYVKDDLESKIMIELRKISVNRESIIKEKSVTENNTKVLKKRIASLDNKIKKLSDLYLNDLLSLDELQIQTDKLKKEKKTLMKELTDAPKEKPSITYLKDNKIDVDNMEYKDLKYLCNVLIDHVDVDNDTFSIHWKF